MPVPLPCWAPCQRTVLVSTSTPQTSTTGNDLLAALRDPDRGFTAVVIGEPQRAFYANQFSLTYPSSSLRRRPVGPGGRRAHRPRQRSPQRVRPLGGLGGAGAGGARPADLRAVPAEPAGPMGPRPGLLPLPLTQRVRPERRLPPPHQRLLARGRPSAQAGHMACPAGQPSQRSSCRRRWVWNASAPLTSRVVTRHHSLAPRPSGWSRAGRPASPGPEPCRDRSAPPTLARPRSSSSPNAEQSLIEETITA